MKCGCCGLKMQWRFDTLVCPICDIEILFDLSYVEKNLKENNR